VKICGLTRRGDAEAAAAAGADFLGTVLVPGTPRAVEPRRAGEITAGLGVPVVVVSAESDAAVLADQARSAGASVIQLHGDQPPTTAFELGERGDWQIWRAFRVRDPRMLPDQVAPWLDRIDGVLVDGWHGDLLGGSGVAFDWAAAAEWFQALPSGVLRIAAGGLWPENVGEAIRVLQPQIVDVSSGVEREPGLKDPETVRSFIAAAKRDR
jgi:phosphoribosylanthranilate isomerase